MRYQRKPIVVEAFQWFVVSDNPLTVRQMGNCIVTDENRICPECQEYFRAHGRLINSRYQNGDVVCPGNWVIILESGRTVSMSTQKFERKYALVEEEMLCDS